MYSNFYGFEGEAFGDEPDPRFYFDSLTHRKAMSYLGYGLKQGEGFIVVTGEPGSGKTTLLGHLKGKLERNRVLVAAVDVRDLSKGSIEGAVAKAFGIEQGAGPDGPNIESFLQQKAREGLRVLLVVDDCQRLPASALEELRLLTNLHLGTHPLLQTLLLGQPEFKRLLSKSGELSQLRERIIAAHNLEPMQPGEIESYVKHRLEIVGWTNAPEFHKSIWLPLHKRSGGSPLAVNRLLSQLLAAGANDELMLLKPDLLAEREETEEPAQAQTKELPLKTDATPEPKAAARNGGGLAEAQLRALQQAFLERDRAIARLRKDIAELRGTEQVPTSDKASDTESRLGDIEGRLDEQDAAIKQIMSALVEILENSRAREAA